MTNERGISERNLVKEIIELWKDVRMYRDKIHSYDRGDGMVNGDDTEYTSFLYFKYILSLDKIRFLSAMGRKYSSHGGVDWDEYDVNVNEYWGKLSFENENIGDLLNGSQKNYLLGNVDGSFLGFK